nr:phosphate-starvation-inducible PsiE family protein [uncultured Acetobacterium sp.]
MKKRIKARFMSFVQILEIIIAIMIICAAIISMVALIGQLFNFANNPNDLEGFSTFLGAAFNVIIGLEFLKMIIKQTPGSVVEVLLFAISRQLVVEHMTALENLLGVLAIAVLFLIYRYLLVCTPDEPFSPMRTSDSDEPVRK